MVTILQYSPGSQVTILLETLNATGIREDGYSTPVVAQVILPDMTTSTLYPLDMVKISTGLYYHKFVLSPGSSGVGTYIVDLSWSTAANEPKQEIVQVICTTSSGGQFSVSPN